MPRPSSSVSALARDRRLERLQAAAAARGGRWSATTYTNTTTKVSWRCGADEREWVHDDGLPVYVEAQLASCTRARTDGEARDDRELAELLTVLLGPAGASTVRASPCSVSAIRKEWLTESNARSTSEGSPRDGSRSSASTTTTTTSARSSSGPPAATSARITACRTRYEAGVVEPRIGRCETVVDMGRGCGWRTRRARA